MNTRLATVTAALCLWVLATPIVAQDFPSPAQPEHEHLKVFAGDWELEVKSLEQKDQPPVRLYETCELVCNKLFVRSTIRGEVAGQPIEMLSLFGYNPHEKHFAGFAARSDSPLPMTCTGTYDEKTKTFALKGVKPGPQQTPVPFRCEYVVVGDDERRETIWRIDGDGKDSAVTEITFKRVKGSAATPRPASAEVPAAKSARLTELTGSWTGKMSMKMAGMGDMEAETEDTCTLVCGGRWVYTSCKSSFGGMSGEMHQILGIDEASKKVVSLWIDSFGGNMDRGDGSLAEGKTWLLRGKTRGPDGELAGYTEESILEDADHRVLRWVIGEGEEKHTIEISYTRKK